MTDPENKSGEAPDVASITIQVDALTIANASTSANSVIREFVKQFSKAYGEQAAEVNKDN